MAHHTPVAEAPQLMASEAATQIGELTEKWQMIVSHHLRGAHDSAMALGEKSISRLKIRRSITVSIQSFRAFTAFEVKPRQLLMVPLQSLCCM